MNKINIRPIEDAEVEDYIKYFDEEDFFYCTKRPSTINYGMRIEIISDSKLLIVDDEVIGLAKICEKESKLYTKIQLRYFKNEFYKNEVGKEVTQKFIDECINIYNYEAKVYLEVYDFDEMLKDHCEIIALKKAGILRKKVFKYNQYNDILVFSN